MATAVAAGSAAARATAAPCAGGTITLSMSWFEGSLPAVCTRTFVRALETTLEVLAQSGQEVVRRRAGNLDGRHEGGEKEATKSVVAEEEEAGRYFVVDGSTSIAEVVRQVERRLVEV